MKCINIKHTEAMRAVRVTEMRWQTKTGAHVPVHRQGNTKAQGEATTKTPRCPPSALKG